MAGTTRSRRSGGPRCAHGTWRLQSSGSYWDTTLHIHLLDLGLRSLPAPGVPVCHFQAWDAPTFEGVTLISRLPTAGCAHGLGQRETQRHWLPRDLQIQVPGPERIFAVCFQHRSGKHTLTFAGKGVLMRSSGGIWCSQEARDRAPGRPLLLICPAPSSSEVGAQSLFIPWSENPETAQIMKLDKLFFPSDPPSFVKITKQPDPAGPTL